MSKYNEKNILTADGEHREEFEEYVRDLLGQKVQITDVIPNENNAIHQDKIAMIDTVSSYYMFRYEKGDLSDNEFDKVMNFGSKQQKNDSKAYQKSLDDYTHCYFGSSKNFSDLTTSQQCFIKAAQELATNLNVSPEEIAKRHDYYFDQEIAEEKKTTEKSINNTNSTNTDQKAPLNVNVATGKNSNENNKQKELKEEEDLRRVRSYDSDINAYMIDGLSYGILQSMGKTKAISDEELKNQEKIHETVQKAVDSLSAKENEEFNTKFVDTVATNETTLETVPPSVLAQAYLTYTTKLAQKNQEIEQAGDDDAKKQQLIAERNEMLTKKGNIAQRIDDLTDMLVADTHDDKDLFFADDTNVADVYDSYKKMFDVRAEDLKAQQDENNPNPAITDRLQKMENGQQALDVQYNSYLETFGLQGVSKDNAEALNKRYDEISKGLKDVQLNDETAAQVITQTEDGKDITLGSLLGSVKFYDADGNVEPQFKDKDGNKTTEWSEGAKVIEGSKLDQSLAMAKQLYVQNNLTSNAEPKPEELQKALTEYLPQVLYATNVKSLVEKNVLETPDQYKDRDTINKNVQEFVKQVEANDKPMEIADNTFRNVKNSMVNQAYAYQGVLAKQMGVTSNDDVDKTPVLNKVCNNIKPLDERPNSRVIKAVTPNVWKNYASETLQGMAAAAIGTARVKGAQLCAIGAAHAVTGIATAHLALAASAIVPIAMTTKQILSWRKEQKAQGKPTGFKAFMKDKNMRWTLATTALTEAAVGCMFVPGAQPVAVALGAAALAIGVGRAAANDYKKLRAAGKSKWKALAAATLGAGLKVGTALLMNKAMTNLFNNHFGEHVEHKEEVKAKSHMEFREGDELAGHARQTLDNFYKGNPEGLEQDLAQVKAQLHAMGRDDISPEVFLRNACDAGMNTGTNTINHVDGGGIVHTGGNNLVMTDAWAQQYGINTDGVHALGGIRGADGAIHITSDALKGFDDVKYAVSVHNEIGSTINPNSGNRLEGHQDGVLHRNATVNDANQTVHADGDKGTEFNTYANHNNNGYEQHEVIDQQAIPAHDEVTKINYNDAPIAVGMQGIRNGGWIHKLVDRVGALKDRIIGKKAPTNKGVPETKKTYVKPAIEVKNPVADEYKIVYGIEPTQKAEVAYKKLVLDEMKADREAGKTQTTNLVDYIAERKATYDEKLATTIAPTKEDVKGFHETKEGKEATAKARQDMFQTNFSNNGQDLPRNKITLQKFTEFATYALSNGADRSHVTAAHDNSMGRSNNDDYNERPSGGRFDVNTGQVTGQTTNKGKGVKDANITTMISNKNKKTNDK